jgi:hypothetical protein
MVQIIPGEGEITTSPFRPSYIHHSSSDVPKWRSGKWKAKVKSTFYDECVDGVVIKWWYRKTSGEFYASLITYDILRFRTTREWDYTLRVYVDDDELLPPKPLMKLIMPKLEDFTEYLRKNNVMNIESTTSLSVALKEWRKKK